MINSRWIDKRPVEGYFVFRIALVRPARISNYTRVRIVIFSAAATKMSLHVHMYLRGHRRSIPQSSCQIENSPNPGADSCPRKIHSATNSKLDSVLRPPFPTRRSHFFSVTKYPRDRLRSSQFAALVTYGRRSWPSRFPACMQKGNTKKKQVTRVLAYAGGAVTTGVNLYTLNSHCTRKVHGQNAVCARKKNE